MSQLFSQVTMVRCGQDESWDAAPRSCQSFRVTAQRPALGEEAGMAGKACLFFADQRRLQCTSGFNQLSGGY